MPGDGPSAADSDSDDDSSFGQIVHTACEDILTDPLRSDVVSVGEIADDPQVRDAAPVSDEAIRTRIGTVLTNADYAEKVARNKYRIHNEPPD